jgi:hypothetical protein
MTRPIAIYYIYYGSWPEGSPAPALLPLLIAGLSGSTRWAVNTRYYQADGRHVTSSVTFAGSTSLGYRYGRSLDSLLSVWQIVVDTVKSGAEKADAGGTK